METDRRSPSSQTRQVMWYWRGENFRGLTELIQLLTTESDLAEYVEYLRFREKGLRKDAFNHLDRFLATARHWELGQRCKLVDRLMQLRQDHPTVYDLIPTPLLRELITPTLDEWIIHEPTNSVPFRWRGMSHWSGSKDDLRRSVELDPHEHVARTALARRLLNEVFYSTHELPSGYIGSVSEDMQKLDEVQTLLNKWPAEDGHRYDESIAASLQELRKIITSHLAANGGVAPDVSGR